MTGAMPERADRMVFNVWKQRDRDGNTYVYVCCIPGGPAFTAPNKGEAHRALWEEGYRNFTLMEMAYDPPRHTARKAA